MQVALPAFAWHHAADHLGAVGDGTLRQPRRGGAGQPLTNDLGITVDQNAHVLGPSCRDNGQLGGFGQIGGVGDLDALVIERQFG